MKKYVVSAEVTISVYTTVEASSKKEALRIAAKREMSGLSRNAFYPCGDEAWVTDELDGTPCNFIAEEE